MIDFKIAGIDFKGIVDAFINFLNTILKTFAPEVNEKFEAAAGEFDKLTK